MGYIILLICTLAGLLLWMVGNNFKEALIITIIAIIIMESVHLFTKNTP